MANIPTDEQIREELHATINSDPKLKCCANCMHYNLVAQYCSKIEKSFPRYFYGCKHYITHEEMLIAKARENLIEQAKECEKVEFLLAMSFTLAGTTSLVIEDLERRVKSVYQREKENKAAKALRSDLLMAAQMDRAFKVIDDHLVKIETQYRLYIQSQLDKIFKKEGLPYNAEGYEQFQADCGEVATFILEMARVGHHNRENMDKVYRYMRQLVNENANEKVVTFCLDDKDIGHYRLKE
jgi:hypothetical protein